MLQQYYKKEIKNLISFIKSKKVFFNTPALIITLLFLSSAKPIMNKSHTIPGWFNQNKHEVLLKKVSFVHFGHIKLNINASGNFNSNTDFYFNSNASLGLDPGYDGALSPGNPASFSIYSHLVENNPGIAFSIQALNEDAMNNVTIPLGIHAIQNQEVTVSIIESDMPADIDIYLEDSENNTTTLLNTGNYVFTANSNITGVTRFSLRFEGDQLSLLESSLKNTTIFSDIIAKTIVIKGQLKNEPTFKLYDINGRLVLSDNLITNNNLQTINVNALTPGIYIIELKTAKNDRLTKKLIIK